MRIEGLIKVLLEGLVEDEERLVRDGKKVIDDLKGSLNYKEIKRFLGTEKDWDKHGIRALS